MTEKCKAPNGMPESRSDQAPPRIDSRDLFGTATRLEIRHRGEVYRLQITRLGKLILTK